MIVQWFKRIFRWSDKQTREMWTFALTVLQALAIIVGALFAGITFGMHQLEQKAAVTRELRKPYDEKQLEFYADAARVLAHLAVVTDNAEAQKDGTLTNFWELYWGQLPLVETDNIRTLMRNYCKSRFPNNDWCGGPAKVTPDDHLSNAIAMAKAAKCEIQERWADKPPSDCGVGSR